MNLYTKEQLKVIKQRAPQSVYNRLKKVNGFLNKDYSRYMEAYNLIRSGAITWQYSTPLEDIQYFSKTQEYILDLIN
jgi:hypothetical protein